MPNGRYPNGTPNGSRQGSRQGSRRTSPQRSENKDRKSQKKPPKSPQTLREQDWQELNSTPQVQRRKKGYLALIYIHDYSRILQYSH